MSMNELKKIFPSTVGLLESLEKFVKRESQRFEDELAEEALDAVRNGEVDCDKLVNNWTKAFSSVSSRAALTSSDVIDMKF